MTSTRQMIITLFAVALVCSIVLSFVYSFTAPRIENTQKELILASLREVIVAAEFVEVVPETLWEAQDSAGNLVGIVFRVFPQGYAASIPITVGLDLEGTITGIRIATAGEGMKETPGLGAKILEPDFKDQFTGKEAPQVQLKQDGGEIDGITAATISSRAVCSGIKKGMEKYSQQLNALPDMKIFFTEADKYIAIVEDTVWYAIKENDTLGIVFIGKTMGYLADIVFMVGVNQEMEITGVEIVSSQETEGIGEEIRNQEFLSQFKEGTPEAISGATISSEALIKAVTAHIEQFKEYVE
jgi:electron transport complex protein RnfG